MTDLHAILAAIAATKPRRKPRRKEEATFQSSLFEMLQVALPPDAVLTSIDHADSSVIQAVNRKRRGVEPGIPDIWILWRGPTLVVLETKARDGRLRIEQAAWRDALRPLGVHWSAPRTPEEAFATVRAAGIPLRARIT